MDRAAVVSHLSHLLTQLAKKQQLDVFQAADEGTSHVWGVGKFNAEDASPTTFARGASRCGAPRITLLMGALSELFASKNVIADRKQQRENFVQKNLPEIVWQVLH